MQRVVVARQAESLDALALGVTDAPLPVPTGEEVLVALHAAGVNPSDVKACFGAMPQAVWPRTPGRDWAGEVLQGPADLVGKPVFGTGGDLGIIRDGSHATHLLVHRDAAVPLPETVALVEAGAMGVPFVTAYRGLLRAGLPKSGDIVLIMGVNGKVGQAATQIASRAGARVFGVERRGEKYAGHAVAPPCMIDARATDIAALVRDETGGHGADIVFNTVGSPYFEAANAAMAHGGRQVFISTVDRAVAFNIFAFYRGEHAYFGVDSLALDARASAALLRELLPGFATGELRPFPIASAARYPLARVRDAYRAVLDGARGRVAIVPGV